MPATNIGVSAEWYVLCIEQLPYCLELPRLPENCPILHEDDPAMREGDYQEIVDSPRTVSVRQPCPSCPVCVALWRVRCWVNGCPVRWRSACVRSARRSCPSSEPCSTVDEKSTRTWRWDDRRPSTPAAVTRRAATSPTTQHTVCPHCRQSPASTPRSTHLSTCSYRTRYRPTKGDFSASTSTTRTLYRYDYDQWRTVRRTASALDTLLRVENVNAQQSWLLITYQHNYRLTAIQAVDVAFVFPLLTEQYWSTSIWPGGRRGGIWHAQLHLWCALDRTIFHVVRCILSAVRGAQLDRIFKFIILWWRHLTTRTILTYNPGDCTLIVFLNTFPFCYANSEFRQIIKNKNKTCKLNFYRGTKGHWKKKYYLVRTKWYFVRTKY